jgi:uncharacterized protein (DUF2126 family)
VSALYPLQVAVVGRLKGNAGVVALVAAKVFDMTAPTGTVEPWVTVDTPTGVEEGNTLGGYGFGHTITVHAHATDRTGNEEVSAVGAAVKAALRAPLTITGHVAGRLKLDFETTLAEPNRRHMPMRFRLTAWET